ncbi:MAG: hypothetical protein JOZ22_09360 [Acidobacteriia bacterium]|nr:hypothetical protein [Terriglobia bacterium]
MRLQRFVRSISLLVGGVLCAYSQSTPVASRNARAAPDFLNRSVIYQVWMRSFTPEGTLSAVQAMLPHIASSPG